MMSGDRNSPSRNDVISMTRKTCKLTSFFRSWSSPVLSLAFSPRWGDPDAEINAPFAKSPKLLKVACSGSEYSFTCLIYRQEFRLSDFCLNSLTDEPSFSLMALRVESSLAHLGQFHIRQNRRSYV